MRLVLNKGKKQQWFELEADGKKLMTSWGARGVVGKTKTKTFSAPAKAKAAYEAMVAEKLTEGYRDPSALGAPPPKDTPRNPTLEAAIRAHRDDPAAYQVYADWLQERGAPLGELIVLQQQNKQARAAKLIDAMSLPGENRATYGWRNGFWQWLRLENGHDWTDNNFNAPELARTLFSQPMCAALEELRIGVLRWDHNDTDVPAVLDEARKHAWAGELVSLHLGDIEGIDMAHHMIGDVGKVISRSFPGLRRLKLHSGEQTWRGGGETFGLSGLQLPELRELVIETCSLSKKRLAHLLAAKLPKLEKLWVWFGSERWGCDASIKGLPKLLDGSVFPGVRHLGLCNAEFQNDIAIALTSSKIARRLETLDLSMGTMTEIGADALIASAKAFPKLAVLDVSDNFLAPATVRAIKKAFPFATADRQKEPDNSIEGETHYYVSVSE